MLTHEFKKVWEEEIIGRWPEWAKKRTAIDISDWQNALTRFPKDVAAKAIQQYRVSVDELPKIPAISKMCYAILNPPQPSKEQQHESLQMKPIDPSPEAHERMMSIFRGFAEKHDNVSMYLRSVLYRKCPTYRNIEPLGEEIVGFFNGKDIVSAMAGTIGRDIPETKSPAELRNQTVSEFDRQQAAELAEFMKI